LAPSFPLSLSVPARAWPFERAAPDVLVKKQNQNKLTEATKRETNGDDDGATGARGFPPPPRPTTPTPALARCNKTEGASGMLSHNATTIRGALSSIAHCIAPLYIV
jgi:hypothetical protein